MSSLHSTTASQRRTSLMIPGSSQSWFPQLHPAIKIDTISYLLGGISRYAIQCNPCGAPPGKCSALLASR